MTRDEKVKRAQELRAEGLLLREIADRMGAKLKTVASWLNDPDLSRQRARRDGYRGTCCECGAPTDGSNGKEHAPDRCVACRAQFQHDTRLWTPETIVEAMQTWAAVYGSPPTASEWSPSPSLRRKATRSAARLDRRAEGRVVTPPANTVLREFGTWNDGLRAAGFEPLREFNRPYAADPTILDDVVAMRRAGQTLQQIATQFGVSDTRASQWLDMAGEPRAGLGWRANRERVAA